MGNVPFQSAALASPAAATIVETIDTGGGVERQVVTIGDRAGGAVDSIGGLTETAPATDTASSGLNGRLQRVSQRLSSLVALLPGALGAGGGLKVDGSGTALPVSLSSLPALVAGTAIIGKVTTDQTTHGTTDLVAADGTIAAGVADTGNPIKIGGVYNTAPATLTNGQRGNFQCDAKGNMNVVLHAQDSASGVGTATSMGDGISINNAVLYTQGFNYLLSGSSFDRQRANFDTAALITLSAAGASTVNSADQVNYNGRGVQVGINLTTMTTATVTVHIQGKDIASGQYYDILVSAGLVATGFTQLTVYPGGLTTANVATPQPLPRTWRVQAVVVGASAAATGTIGASVIL